MTRGRVDSPGRSWVATLAIAAAVGLAACGAEGDASRTDAESAPPSPRESPSTTPPLIVLPSPGVLRIERPGSWEPFREADTGMTGYRLRGDTVSTIKVVRSSTAGEKEEAYEIHPGGYVVFDERVIHVRRSDR